VGDLSGLNLFCRGSHAQWNRKFESCRDMDTCERCSVSFLSFVVSGVAIVTAPFKK